MSKRDGCSFDFKVTSSKFELKDFPAIISVSSLSHCLKNTAATCCRQSYSLSRRQAPQNMTTFFLLHSEALQQTQVTVPAGGWVISPWIQWIVSRNVSSPIVKCRGTISLIPCATNSYPIWNTHGWSCIRASYSRTRSAFYSPTSLSTGQNRHQEATVTLRRVQQRRQFRPSQSGPQLWTAPVLGCERGCQRRSWSFPGAPVPSTALSCL